MCVQARWRAAAKAGRSSTVVVIVMSENSGGRLGFYGVFGGTSGAERSYVGVIVV